MAKLLQFTVGNYRSFKEERTFTFAPTQIQDEPKNSISCIGKNKFSTISAIYGANSSGKSNFVFAIAAMCYIVGESVKLNDGDELAYYPFMLSTESTTAPMRFEITYLDQHSRRIRYGFENTSRRIVSEWLYIAEANKDEQIMFLRDEEGIGVNEALFKEGIDREEMTNDNRLFISLVAQIGGEISKSVVAFFRSECSVMSGLETKDYAYYTKKQFQQHNAISENAMSLFRNLQLGFTNLSVKERGASLELFSTHNIYDTSGEVAGNFDFLFSESESNGTQKIFELAGPIFDTLRTGNVLVIDELDAKMHPLISQHIVRLFTNEATNPKHAQLLFTTHDTNLLSAKLLRRDQIWFTEKDATESTDLYRLTDIVLPDGSKPRGDGNIERNYIKGRYGAIPFIINSSEW